MLLLLLWRATEKSCEIHLLYTLCNSYAEMYLGFKTGLIIRIQMFLSSMFSYLSLQSILVRLYFLVIFSFHYAARSRYFCFSTSGFLAALSCVLQAPVSLGSLTRNAGRCAPSPRPPPISREKSQYEKNQRTYIDAFPEIAWVDKELCLSRFINKQNGARRFRCHRNFASPLIMKNEKSRRRKNPRKC